MYMDIYRALSTAACGLCLGRGGAGPAAGGGVGGPEACLAAGGGPGSLPPIPQSSAPCPRRPQGSPDTGRGGAVPAAPPGPFRACCGRGRDGASWTGHGVGHREAGAGLRRGSPRGEWAGSGLGAPSNGEGRKVPPDRAGEVPVVVVVPPLASASPGGTGSRPPPSCLELSAGSGTPPCRARAANGGGFASCPSRRQVGRAHSPRRALQEDDAPRRGHLQRR